jgi:sterol 24-C-methyltransferase
MADLEKRVRGYYATLESRLGYKFILWDAKHFGYYPDKTANISEKKALELQQDLIANKLGLLPGQRILDAGCGRGVTACYIAGKFSVKVIGIDVLDFEIRSANVRAQKRNLSDKAEFRVMSFADVKYPDNYFDAIYTSETLSHAPDVNHVLKEFYRVLKPGGKIALAEYTLAPDDLFTAAEMKDINFIIEGSAMSGLRTFRHDNFRVIMQEAGFIHTQEENITGNFLPSLQRLYRKSRWIYPILKFLNFPKALFNAAVPTKLLPLAQKDLVRYCIFFAQKLSENEVDRT